jgi:hypothetical protein
MIQFAGYCKERSRQLRAARIGPQSRCLWQMAGEKPQLFRMLLLKVIGIESSSG